MTQAEEKETVDVPIPTEISVLPLNILIGFQRLVSLSYLLTSRWTFLLRGAG